MTTYLTSTGATGQHVAATHEAAKHLLKRSSTTYGYTVEELDEFMAALIDADRVEEDRKFMEGGFPRRACLLVESF